jgi:hypothetical protein
LPILKEERGKAELKIDEGILIWGKKERRKNLPNDGIINPLQPLFSQ